MFGFWPQNWLQSVNQSDLKAKLIAYAVKYNQFSNLLELEDMYTYTNAILIQTIQTL